MAMKAQALGTEGMIVSNITLFAVLIYEIVGPTLTKLSLQKAGEIKPEGKTSARVLPEKHKGNRWLGEDHRHHPKS